MAEDRISATTLSEAELSNIIKALISPRNEGESTGRFHDLHRKIRQREEHFYNTKEADPKLPAPHDQNAEPFQSDVLRRAHLDIRYRLTENPYRVRVIPPKDRATQRRASDDLEKVLQLGIEMVEGREDFSILSDLADGMGQHAFGVLHWQLATDIWPEVPDPALHNISNDEALQQHEENKAKAGFPFYIECPRADQIAFIEDKSALNGMGLVVYMREVGLLDYKNRLGKEELAIGTVSVNQERSGLRIYTEQTKPANFEPSGSRPDDWGRSVTIAQVWTRDEVYELVAESTRGATASEWTLVKSSTHGYEMPPFALAYADRMNHPDPSRRYLPYLEGVFKLKPFVDYDMTVARQLAHQIAMPFYWIKLADGTPMLDEAGNRVVLSHNSLAAQALPAGAELVKVDFEMNPAFVEFLNRTKEEMEQAIPDAGNIDVGASTQPWTIRLATEISNVPIASLKRNMARTIKAMVANMMLVMQKPADKGGIGEPVGVYARVKNGSVEEETLVAVDPEDIISMQVEVDIAPHSTAQTVAAQEHGRILMNDPLVPYPTQVQYLEQFVHISNPDEQLDAYDAEQIWLNQVKPTVIGQALAEEFAAHITLGPDGTFVGPGGQSVSPEDVLAQNGATLAPAVDPTVVQEAQNTTALPDLNVPGATTTQGVPR